MNYADNPVASITPEHWYRFFQSILRDANIGFQVAPYTAWAQVSNLTVEFSWNVLIGKTAGVPWEACTRMCRCNRWIIWDLTIRFWESYHQIRFWAQRVHVDPAAQLSDGTWQHSSWNVCRCLHAFRNLLLPNLPNTWWWSSSKTTKDTRCYGSHDGSRAKWDIRLPALSRRSTVTLHELSWQVSEEPACYKTSHHPYERWKGWAAQCRACAWRHSRIHRAEATRWAVLLSFKGTYWPKGTQLEDVRRNHRTAFARWWRVGRLSGADSWSAYTITHLYNFPTLTFSPPLLSTQRRITTLLLWSRQPKASLYYGCGWREADNPRLGCQVGHHPVFASLFKGSNFL